MHRKVAAALVAALALGIASCGGSESELTRAQLVNQIEKACREGQRVSAEKQRAIGRSGGMTAFVNSIVAGQEALIDRTEDLKAPDAAQANFDAFKDGLRERLDQMQRVASADRADLQRAIREVQPRIEAISRRLTAAVRRLGVEGCV
jgi:hypothetical protein